MGTLGAGRIRPARGILTEMEVLAVTLFSAVGLFPLLDWMWRSKPRAMAIGIGVTGTAQSAARSGAQGFGDGSRCAWLEEIRIASPFVLASGGVLARQCSSAAARADCEAAAEAR